MKIIAFGHRKETGKDTCAKYLTTELRLHNKGIDIKKVGFADKVKDIAYQLYSWAGIQPGYFYDEPKNRILKETILPKLNKTPRQIWIGVGNGIRSATGHDETWLNYVFNTIKCDVLIVSDLRFPAEADGILNQGGYIYKVECPWSPVVTDGADEPLATYDKWTGIIKNDQKDNYNHLYNQIRGLIKIHFNGTTT